MKTLRALWRNFRNRKVYFVINVIGLALGIASAILILLWIVDELSYEKMHENSGQVSQLYKQYRMGEQLQVNPSLPMPLGPSVKEELPEILEVVRVVAQRNVVAYGDQLYSERTICAADPGYFEIFSFSFESGNPQTCLTESNSIVLTSAKARKYFGEEEALGKVLEFDGRRQYVVTGVIQNISGNTAMDYDMIIPFSSVYRDGSEEDSWYDHFVDTYILAAETAQTDSLNARLTRHVRSKFEEENKIEIFAHPIRDLHLHKPGVKNPRIMYVYIFSIVGFLVLLIACINYANVSTFVSLRRSREIGVRKINGGSRFKLLTHFFLEALQQTSLGFILAMALVELLRLQFNQLTGKTIVIPYLEPWFLLSLLGLIVLTTLLAGIYPAILISNFKPVDAFRGRIITGKGQSHFRTLLLVFQFSISVGLLITTLTMYKQVGFMQNKNLGFEKENLLYLHFDDAQQLSYPAFKQKLLAHSQLTHVCRASSLPASVWNIVRGLTWEGHDEEQLSAFSFLAGDQDLIPTLGLEVLSGRGFSPVFTNDSSRVLINEEAARMLGFEDPVGKVLMDDSSQIEIIGLFRNFHGLPLTEPLEPMIIVPWTEFFYYCLVRLGPGNPKEAIAHIESVWKELYPEIPFDVGFIDEQITRQYRSEIRVGKLAGAFTILAILITSIGLFAIAGHTAQESNKEIGIRKTLGASSGSVVKHFVFIYLKWVLVANVIAIPVSWIMMNNWLENFAYRSPLSFMIFLLAAAVSILISVLTIAWHALNTARTNPVVALKCD